MSSKRAIPLIGAFLATPTLTAGFQPLAADAHDLRSASTGSVAIVDNDGAGAALKAEMLRLGPAEKLAIAGDRVGFAAPVFRFAAPGVQKSDGRQIAYDAAKRTNTDIPECRGKTTTKTSGAKTATKSNDRTNTDIPECRGNAVTKNSGAKTVPKANDRTNTDIPECRGNALTKSSGAKTIQKSNDRTNTDIPECRGSAAKKSVKPSPSPTPKPRPKS